MRISCLSSVVRRRYTGSVYFSNASADGGRNREPGSLAFPHAARSGQLLAQLEAGHYAAALTALEAFLRLQARLTLYKDPLLAALCLEVRNLQYRLVAVEAEIAESEHLLGQYNHEFARQLGALTEEILRLKQAHAQHQRQQGPYAETEYEEARRRYDDFRQEHAAEAKKTVLPLDAADQQTLRKPYRHCATLCHPDKVAEHLRPQAEAAFKRLQAFHDRQDLAQLHALAANLAQGIFGPAAAPDTTAADRAPCKPAATTSPASLRKPWPIWPPSAPTRPTNRSAPSPTLPTTSRNSTPS